MSSGQHAYKGHRPRSEDVPKPPLPKADVARWITVGIDRQAIDYTERLAKHLAGGFTRSQFRNVFGELRRIQMRGIRNESERTAFLLLRPKMAYAVAREQGNRRKEESMKAFKEFFDEAHQHVELDGDPGIRFDRFMQLMEAVLAFHRAHGGKD